MSFSDQFTDGLSSWTVSTEGGPSAPIVLPVCRFAVASGEKRQELVSGPNWGVKLHAGDDVYFHGAYLLPDSWPMSPTWQVVRQWKTDTPTSATGPSVGLLAGAWGIDEWIVAGCGWPGSGSREAHSLGPIARGAWTQIVTRINFSTDPTASIVQVWRADGSQPFAQAFDSTAKQAEVLDTVHVETRPGWWPSFTGEAPGSQGGTFRQGCQGAYEKHGIYRDPANPKNATLISAGSVWSTTPRAAIAPWS